MGSSKGVKVSPKDADNVRRLLREQGVLDTKRIKQSEGVVLPIKCVDFDLHGISFEVVDDEFEEFKSRNDFEGFIEGIGCSISSYDVIGGIAVIEIPFGFETQKRRIGEALLNSKNQITAVYKKSSEVKGEERVRAYEWLAGEKRTETTHREHGCEFKLDISKVFFSPRLAFERQRIMEQVSDGEVIVDLFAGVGPYSITIAKQRDVKVQGYDINKQAIGYFRENIRINKLGHRVRAIHGDCRELAPVGAADRAIMNLPKSGNEFLDTAMDTIKPKGGIVHYYGVSKRDHPFEADIEFILKTVEERGETANIINRRVVRSYSPSEVHVAIDVRLGS